MHHETTSGAGGQVELVDSSSLGLDELHPCNFHLLVPEMACESEKALYQLSPKTSKPAFEAYATSQYALQSSLLRYHLLVSLRCARRPGNVSRRLDISSPIIWAQEVTHRALEAVAGRPHSLSSQSEYVQYSKEAVLTMPGKQAQIGQMA